MNSQSENCAIDIPSENQDDTTDFKLSKPFSDKNRCPSESSSLDSNTADICRICHCEGGPDLPLITPCYCAGSLRYVHQTCLQQWIKSSNIRSCELCKFQFIMQTKVKPFNEWEYLEMSGLERKKLACAMLFHIIAMTCVCWSLYVLIDRTLDEVRKGHLEWPFWTKLIVVGIGFMGGIVFMYIQCRAYFVLCKRWKAYNRVIYVQNAPEKVQSQLSRQSHTTVVEKDPNGPSCSFKSYAEPRSKRDTKAEPNCIDIKGVHNLCIFFGDENQIRVHRDDRRSAECKALTQPDRIEETSPNGHGNTSLHIQIGNGGGTTNESKKNGADADEEKATSKDQSVVKVQFKKAEIVIEFGQKNTEETTPSLKRADTVANGYDTCDGVVVENVSSASPKRKFSSEEYLDSELKYTESVPNETNESPTSKLLINYRCSKVPFNNYFKERALLKDWKSSEDLLDVRSSLSNF